MCSKKEKREHKMIITIIVLINHFLL